PPGRYGYPRPQGLAGKGSGLTAVLRQSAGPKAPRRSRGAFRPAGVPGVAPRAGRALDSFLRTAKWWEFASRRLRRPECDRKVLASAHLRQRPAGPPPPRPGRPP